MSQTLLELELNVRKATNTCIACGELIGEDRNHHCDEKKIGRRDSMMLNGRKHPGRSDFLRLPGARLEEGFNMMRGNCEYSPMEEE